MNIIKKFALLLTICATLSFSTFQVAFAYPDYVAVISNYKDVKDKIKNGIIQIHRAHGKPTGSQSLLYPGDKITGDVAYIKFECITYADFHNVNNQYYEISYNPPTGIDKVADEFQEIKRRFMVKVCNILEDNVELDSIASTKGAESNNNTASYGFDLNPRPGFNTTLLNYQKVTFAGVPKTDKYDRAIAPKGYVVKDSRGQVIFSGNFDKNGETTLDLTSKNLQAGEKYSWIVDGKTEYDFTILDADTTKTVQEYFDRVDAKKTSPEQRNLEKAFWAQYFSDNSDGKIDLYWLSAQWLMEISPKSEDDQKEKFMLLQKCHNHLKYEFKRYLAG